MLHLVIKRGKDKSDKLENPGVVYFLKCDNCQYVYVGETRRTCNVRMKEHKCDVRYKKDTVVAKHCNSLTHKIVCEKTAILDRVTCSKMRKISGMLHIHRQQHTLNMKEDTDELADSYKNLIINLILKVKIQ